MSKKKPPSNAIPDARARRIAEEICSLGLPSDDAFDAIKALSENGCVVVRAATIYSLMNELRSIRRMGTDV